MEEETMLERATPEVLFDLDGTLIHLAERPYGVQNALKYPMYAKPEAHRFIQGIASTGTDIGPIISRRPRFGRTMLTRRTMRDTGLSRWFSAKSDIQLAGSIHPAKFKQSEELKAQRVLEHSKRRVVGMVEDKPDKLGRLLLNGLVKRRATNEPLIIGVAPSDRAPARTDQLIDFAMTNGWSVSEHAETPYQMPGYEITHSRSGIDLLVKVVQVDPFDFNTGVQFGTQLQYYAA